MGAEVRIDASQFQRILNRTGGPGERLLLRKAERVAALARQYASGHGTIAQGISVEPVNRNSVKVLSSNPHSVFVHNGTPRHFIRPIGNRPARSGNGLGYLKFRIGGRIVFARVVDHPGYAGDPFLTNALRDA